MHANWLVIVQLSHAISMQTDPRSIRWPLVLGPPAFHLVTVVLDILIQTAVFKPPKHSRIYAYNNHAYIDLFWLFDILTMGKLFLYFPQFGWRGGRKFGRITAVTAPDIAELETTCLEKWNNQLSWNEVLQIPPSPHERNSEWQE